MFRTALGATLGSLAGVALTLLILYLAYKVIARITAPRLFEIEYSAVYLTLVLGAGFGAVCGTLTGFASALLREWRRSNAPSRQP